MEPPLVFPHNASMHWHEGGENEEQGGSEDGMLSKVAGLF
jgi:hypothetical protein